MLPAGTACFALLELYATHFLLIPYYSGLISHRANGALAAFHVSQLAEVGINTVLLRLQANKPAFLGASVFVVLWLCWLAATLALVAVSLESARSSRRPPAPG